METLSFHRPRRSVRRTLTPVAISWVTLALILTGCADVETPVQPPELRESRLTEAADQPLPITVPLAPASGPGGPAWTLRDEFTSMAERIPGGFGGLFFDDDGVLNVVLQDVGQSGAARAALEQERFIQARRVGPRGESFNPSQARVTAGRWDYARLHAWYRELMRALPDPPRIGSINVEENRLFIGVADPGERKVVLDIAARVGVPPEGLRVDVVPALHSLSVRSKHRPVPAGVQTQYRALGMEPHCTIGPNVTRLGQQGFLVNSHCTRAFGEVDWDNLTHYWQHTVNKWYESPRTRHMGNEAIDPELFPCDENWQGCRNSDAALGLYASYTNPDFGRIARPGSRNTDEIALDANDPRFFIIQAMGWSLGGEVLEKVGRTSGWTGGQVVFQWGPNQEDGGCVDLTRGEAPFATLRCQIIVSVPDAPRAAARGDSGSPVFWMTGGLNVQLRGILWGMIGDCFPGSDGILSCDHFVASNLGGVEYDLDPDWNAPLQYF